MIPHQFVDHDKDTIHIYYTMPIISPKDKQMNGVCLQFQNDEKICMDRTQLKQKMSTLISTRIQNADFYCWNRNISDTSAQKTVTTHYCVTSNQRNKLTNFSRPQR